MSDTPQTMEDWKQFRFPFEPDKGFDQVVAEDTAENEAKDEDEEAGSGTDTGGASAVQLALGPPDEPQPLHSEEPLDEWSFDPDRLVLINWRISRALPLSKMDTRQKVRDYAEQVERHHIDRHGFERALEAACQELFQMSAEAFLDAAPPDEYVAWHDSLRPVQPKTHRSRLRR